jgi:2-succinyl-5-enolpyruvyl-6-hydroxy-3-cyclohexene-1-carboxylate synthase
MYTVIKNLQILIALLKKHGISHLVISPGSRMKDFAFSVEADPFFTCYSVVDERSAAYFALGLAQELDRPVGIVCTSSTATCNYLPGITEAFYQGVPLVVMTGDRDPYYLGQMEDQMIQQIGMYDRVVKKSVNLPIVNNDEDFWYCGRLVNEALLELDHRGCGPVHINVPILYHSQPLTVKELPEVNCIKQISLWEDAQLLQEKVQELQKAQRILVVAGQNTKLENTEQLELFFKKFNCIIYAESMANLNMEGAVNLAVLFHTLSKNVFDDLIPDIVISFGGNTVSLLKSMLRSKYKQFTHWLIDNQGDVIDAFKNLTTIFEGTIDRFLDYFVSNVESETRNNEIYYHNWMEKYNQVIIPELPFSNVFVIQYFLQRIPENSILHLSILNSIRITQFFKLPPNTKVYANIGTDGIDGCMSTYLGQAFVSKRLSFLIVGDLSFFYDMNSIRIRHIKNNVRILLINNGGGGEFYIGSRPNTLDLHIAARHKQNAKEWVESVGFKYQSARTAEDFLSQINKFLAVDSDSPMLFEIFTDMETDADTVDLVYNFNKSILNKGDIAFKIKDKVRSVIGNDNYMELKNNIKGILKK